MSGAGLVTGPLVPLCIPQMIHELMWKTGGIILRGETQRLTAKYVPVPLRSPQTPGGMTLAQTQVFTVRNRRSTT